jgi:hypothetical protein
LNELWFIINFTSPNQVLGLKVIMRFDKLLPMLPLLVAAAPKDLTFNNSKVACDPYACGWCHVRCFDPLPYFLHILSGVILQGLVVSANLSEANETYSGSTTTERLQATQ